MDLNVGVGSTQHNPDVETTNADSQRWWKAPLLVTLLCLGLSAVATLPFFFINRPPNSSAGVRLWMPVTHDMLLHFEQMKSFYHGLAAGALYPRWEEDTNRGFGAPTTSYYPPGVYYLTSALYAISGDWMLAILGAYFLMMAASAAAIYAFARRFLSWAAAVATMVCYIFLPYHLLDQYQRGALAECLAFVFMPLILMFAESLLSDRAQGNGIHANSLDEHLVPSKRLADNARTSQVLLNSLGLSVSIGLFAWSHPPTAYQFLLAFGLYVVASALMRKQLSGLVAVTVAVALGLGLSAAYLYPASVEQDLIRHEFVANTWPYHSSYLFSPRKSYDLIAFAWIFNMAATVIGGVILLVLERGLIKANIGLRRRIWLWLIVGCYASFMMTPASIFVGRLIPKIEIGVFAWRMLGITTLVAALMAGSCAQAAINARRRQRQVKSNSISSLATVAILGGAVFSAFRIVAGIYGTPPFYIADEHINIAIIPRTAPREPMELPRVERAELESGEGRVEVEEWQPEHRVINVLSNKNDKLLVRTFNFPGWRATVDDQPVEIQSGEALRIDFEESGQTLIRAATFRGGTPIVDGNFGNVIGTEPLGDIEIQLDPGVHRVELDYILTSPRRFGVLVSSCSAVLMVGLVLASLVMRFRSA